MSRKKKWQGEEAHDHICDLAQSELERRGFKTLDHYRYISDFACGELDIFAFKPEYKTAILIEVKYNDNYKNRKKADSQTKRAVEHCQVLQQFDKIIRMYAYHNGNGYELHKLR